MTQFFNFPALKLLSRVIREKKSNFLLPHYQVQDLSQIPFQKLKAQGFLGIVFDKDNTLTRPYQYFLEPKLQSSLEDCKATFGPENVVIFSNTVGSSYDRGYEKALLLERISKISVIRHKEQKPGGIDAVISHFNCSADKLVFVGDRYLTDILFGNMNGMLTIYCQILTTDGENFAVRMARSFEGWIVQTLRDKGVRPPHHKLFLENLF
eukprot:TRINITY_DN57_c0_g1_i1.p1 TRINITY_DN57_c0_g1~~TRINITY_DN57_c0_g1_i1.p1  ORF type:complete len:209 (+),score=20.58 TRINITY_DN57_c0_g1_i1:56-682(+)